jgi:hypothetical protein
MSLSFDKVICFAEKRGNLFASDSDSLLKEKGVVS